ncbi:kinase-like protein [Ceratobasidium sp. AG-I]|nr:kinase-like protein [Ceratobasidium sp. AG-I]
MAVIQKEGQPARPNTTSIIINRTTLLPGIVEHLVVNGCPDISEHVASIDETSKFAGRSSDVYQGRMLDGTLVAVKCLRSLVTSDTRPDKLLKHTARELYTWSVSSHPNVLELLGLAVFRDRLAMVSPWMSCGSLLSYIREHPTADRCNLCVQIAEGLAYMHQKGIAHGDVKGDNVVVSDTGIAKLTDFGCATIKREFPVHFTMTESLNYSVRWAAPELFMEEGSSSFETDVYALGMTILEGLTGHVPHKDRADLVVIHTVLVKRQLPTRPDECIPSRSRKGNDLWAMLGRCWSYEPNARSKIDEVREFMKGIDQDDLSLWDKNMVE